MMRYYIFLLITTILYACSEPKARRPLVQKSHSFIKSSVQRNKKRIAAEEAEIKKAIARDQAEANLNKEYGYWYSYVKKDTTTTYTPQPDDEVIFTFEVNTLLNTKVLTAEETGTIYYKIDQTHQELIPGIRRGIKQMREGEIVTFYLPSHLAYGYYGIPDKLGSNYPIKSTVTLQKIIKQH